MSKVAIVFWSGTGNTEEMANSIVEGAKTAGAEVSVFSPNEFDENLVKEFNAIAFGCPAMGAEVLEESEFQPMWDLILPALTGKKVALFGSYDWGDGEWLRTWEEQSEDANINIIVESIMSHNAPSDEDKAKLNAMGVALTK